MDTCGLDVVRLIEDSPEQHLVAGMESTIVGAYPEGYLVFADDRGQTLAPVDLTADLFEVVWKVPRQAGVQE